MDDHIHTLVRFGFISVQLITQLHVCSTCIKHLDCIDEGLFFILRSGVIDLKGADVLTVRSFRAKIYL